MDRPTYKAIARVFRNAADRRAFSTFFTSVKGHAEFVETFVAVHVKWLNECSKSHSSLHVNDTEYRFEVKKPYGRECGCFGEVDPDDIDTLVFFVRESYPSIEVIDNRSSIERLSDIVNKSGF